MCVEREKRRRKKTQEKQSRRRHKEIKKVDKSRLRGGSGQATAAHQRKDLIGDLTRDQRQQNPTPEAEYNGVCVCVVIAMHCFSVDAVVQGWDVACRAYRRHLSVLTLSVSRNVFVRALWGKWLCVFASVCVFMCAFECARARVYSLVLAQGESFIIPACLRIYFQ